MFKNLLKTLLLSAGIVTAALCVSPAAHAQLFVDTTYTAEQMVNDFFNASGTCVTATNVTHTGHPSSIGFFEGSASNVGLNAGIILVSGDVTGAIGPNNSPSQTIPGGGLGTPGDADLDDLIPSYTTFDASVLEMDIVSADSLLEFVYVFGSEEYLEFVNSSFNDVFGFFVSGPGYTGNQNIALIPGTSVPVSINNVNLDSNSTYYINNSDGSSPSDSTQVQYDGLTTVLSAPLNVIPGQTYHIKLAVADAGDSVLDSGVFIGIQSLCGTDSLLTSGGGFAANLSGSTAQFESGLNYCTYWNWDFGDGTSSNLRTPSHTYLADGTYTVTLQTGNFSNQYNVTQTVQVGDVIDGIENNNNAAAASSLITAMPNPTNGIVSIQLNGHHEPLQLNLYSTNGQLLEVRRNVSTVQSFDLNTYGKGAFIIQALTQKEVYTQKIVNQ